MKLCPRCEATFPDDAGFCPFDGAELVLVETASLDEMRRDTFREEGGPARLGRDDRPTGQWKAPAPGDVLLGQYKVIRRRGARGPGRFVEAEDLQSDRLVLLQVYPRPRGTDGAGQRAAMRERAERLVALRDPGAVRVFRAAEDTDKRLVLVSEHAGGFTAAEILKVAGPLPAGRVVRIGTELASTLDAFHRNGVLHLDLRPDVVFLTREGEAEKTLLGGWRIGDLPDDRAVSIPEEQVGQPVDARSDVYLAGVVLYRLLTGTFSAEPPSKAAPGADIPWDLESIVVRAVSTDPAARPADARELRKLLSECRCFGSWTKTQVQKSWAAMPIDDLAREDEARSLPVPRSGGGASARLIVWGAVAAAVAGGLFLLSSLRSGPERQAAERKEILVPSEVRPDGGSPPPRPEPPAEPPPAAEEHAAPHAARPAPAPRPAAPPGASRPPSVALPELPTQEAELPPGHRGRMPLLRGRALFRSGKFGKALKQLKAARKHAKLPAILRDIAACYAALNDYDKAIIWYQRYEAEGQLRPLEKQTLGRLVEHLRARRRGDDAPAEEVPDAFGPAAKDPRSLYLAGSLAYDAGDLRVALTRFKDAYAIAPAAALEYNIGLCLERLGSADEAIQWYERFVRRPHIDPEQGKDLRIRIERLRQGKTSAGVASRLR